MGNIFKMCTGLAEKAQCPPTLSEMVCYGSLVEVDREHRHNANRLSGFIPSILGCQGVPGLGLATLLWMERGTKTKRAFRHITLDGEGDKN